MALQSGQVSINNTVGMYTPRAGKQSSRQRKPAKPRHTLGGGAEAQRACPEENHQNGQHKPALIQCQRARCPELLHSLNVGGHFLKCLA